MDDPHTVGPAERTGTKSSRWLIALAATCAVVGIAVVAPTPRPRQEPARPEARLEVESADGRWRRRPAEVEETDVADEENGER